MIRALLISLISFQAIAGPPPVSIKGQDGTKLIPKWNIQVPYNQATNLGGIDALIETGNGNLLTNASFEASTFSSGWTVLGGVGCATSSSDVIGGKKSVNCSAVGSINDVVSQYVSPSLTTTGRNWEVGIYAAASDVGFSACAVVGGVETQCRTIDVAVNPTYYYFNTPVPNSTAFGIKIKSTTASLKSLKFDEAYVGPARNLAAIPPGGQFVGSVEFGTDCSWSVFGSTQANYAADATCTTTVVQGSGSVSVAGATRPAITVNNAAPGTYEVKFDGPLQNAGSSGQGCIFKIWDGTNVLTSAIYYQTSSSGTTGPGISGNRKYTAPQSSVTFDLYGYGDGASQTCSVIGGSTYYKKMSVYYYPSVDQQAVRADQTNFGLTDAGAVTLAATTTNPTKGTTSKDKIYYSREGQYLVGRVEYVQTGAGASAGSGDYLWTIPSICTPDTSIVGAYSTVEGSAGAFAVRNTIGYGAASDGTNNAMLFNTLYDSTRMRLFYLSGAQASTVGIGAVGSGFYGTTAAALSFAFNFKIPCSNFIVNQNAPTLTGSVTANSSGSEKLNRLKVTNAGTPAISSQSGSWVSSLTDNGVGDVTINFASGFFSGDPSCSCNVLQNVAAPFILCTFKTISSTSARVFTAVSSSGAATDQDFTLSCMGPQ